MERMISKKGILRKANRVPGFKLLATGDTIPGGKAEKFFSVTEENPLLRDIQPILRDGDLLLFNLETPLCRGGAPISKCGSNFRISPETAVGLRAAGFNVAALANNHILDFGPEGLDETIHALENAGIMHLGAACNESDALRPLRYEINGIKIAFLNWAEGEFSKLCADGCGAAPLNAVANKEAIEVEKKSNDIVVVSVHAGNEYQHFPSPVLQETYRRYISYGAAVVIGNHPHIPQGLEWYGDGLIIYSMGDFFFEYQQDPGTCVTYLLELGFDVDGIISAGVHPIRKGPDGHMTLLKKDEKELFISHLNRLSKPLKSPKMLTALWQQGVIRRMETFYAEKLKKNISIAFSRSDAKQFAAGFLYNMFDCPSHSCALQTAFSLLHTGKYKKDNSIQEFITWLNRTLEILGRQEMVEFGPNYEGRFQKMMRSVFVPTKASLVSMVATILGLKNSISPRT